MCKLLETRIRGFGADGEAYKRLSKPANVMSVQPYQERGATCQFGKQANVEDGDIEDRSHGKAPEMLNQIDAHAIAVPLVQRCHGVI